MASAELNYTVTPFSSPVQLFILLGLKSCWTGAGRTRGARSAAASVLFFFLLAFLLFACFRGGFCA